MNRILLNYASGGRFRESQIKNSQTGLAAGLNTIYQMSDTQIDENFREKNKRILESKRGAGYWLWKPYFINKIIGQMTETDILFYSDSGAVFIKELSPVFESVTKDARGVVGFYMAGRLIEKYWTKSDMFLQMELDLPQFKDTPQRVASFMVFRGTSFAKKLIAEYLSIACDYHMISDEPNIHAFVESGFKEHRHDQSIWSLLTKKYDVTMMNEPTQWGQICKESFPTDQYIIHTRDPK